ncbi:flagellar motor protein MotB [Pandoraea norimbergensis]|nr:flagellar motor protein MotB [Pandoraea norimbergensis]
MVVVAAVLALAVLWWVMPFETELAWLCSVLVVALSGLVLWLGGRGPTRAATGASPTLARLEALLAEVPFEQLSDTPVLLVTGDGLSALFDTFDRSNDIHMRFGAIWLRVDDPLDLPQSALAVGAYRDGAPPDGVLISVAPGLHAHGDAIEQRLRSVRQAVADTSGLQGGRLPAYVAIYQRLTSGIPADLPAAAQAQGQVVSETAERWYGMSVAPFPVDARRFESIVRAAEQDAQNAAGALGAAELAASLASVISWTQRVVLKQLSATDLPSPPVALHGVAWIDCGPASEGDSVWASDVSVQTRITRARAAASANPWPLPQQLIAALQRRRPVSPLTRTLTHCVALLACAAGAAFWGAATHNERMLAQVHSHLVRYAQIPPENDTAKREALRVLMAERDRLDRYARLGAPLRMSFGMYRGAALIPVLNEAIASYVPPPMPPSVITLDSLSMFDSGKATLKPGSTRRMVDALAMIKAHAGKRILIAGFTDDVGDAAFNLKLSAARAEAVRNWLVEASGIPATQFAIQGYGTHRPIASNGTEAGRAKNRRVEITLIPDVERPDRSSIFPGPLVSGYHRPGSDLRVSVEVAI